MTYGWPWTKEFITELSDKELRDEFVADKVRTRIALMIRALRDDEGRQWSQTRLGKEMGKPANVVSRLEDPDYGKMSLQTLLEVAAAFDLPLMVDIPSWDDWFRKMRDLSPQKFQHHSFDPELFGSPQPNQTGTGSVSNVFNFPDNGKAGALTSAAAATGNRASSPQRFAFVS